MDYEHVASYWYVSLITLQRFKADTFRCPYGMACILAESKELFRGLCEVRFEQSLGYGFAVAGC
jgi:hypothetical protein